MKGFSTLVMIGALATMGVGCGSKGGTGEAARPSGWPEIVEGGAIFKYHDKDARSVFLVGDFNAWSPKADPLQDPDGDGMWELFYPLRPGTYRYKLVINGKKWVRDPKNPITEPDGFDGEMSIVRITVGSR